MNHMLLGAAIPFLVGLIIYIHRGLRISLPALIILPLSMCLTMTWAVAPDLPRLFGLMGLYNRLNIDPRCNIFFWHYSIDKVETSSPIYPLLFVSMWALLLLIAWQELKQRERGR